MSYPPRSLIPLMLRRDDWWDQALDRYWNEFPSRLFDQHFGQPWDEVAASEFTPPQRPFPPSRTLARQYSRGVRPANSGFSEVTDSTTQFQVKLDVAHFGPSEINVKIDAGSLTITGRHEEKQDEHGYISRQFTRKYLLPRDVITEQITSSLTPEGILTVTAPKRKLEAIEAAKPIPVQIEQSPMSPSTQ